MSQRPCLGGPRAAKAGGPESWSCLKGRAVSVAEGP